MCDETVHGLGHVGDPQGHCWLEGAVAPHHNFFRPVAVSLSTCFCDSSRHLFFLCCRLYSYSTTAVNLSANLLPPTDSWCEGQGVQSRDDRVRKAVDGVRAGEGGVEVITEETFKDAVGG